MRRASALPAVAKRWTLPAIATSVVAAALLRNVIDGLVTVPGRGGIQSLVWPLAGGLPAMVVAGAAGSLLEAPELLARRSPSWQRGVFVAVTVTGTVIAACLSSQLGHMPVTLRNDLLLLGSAWSASVLLSPGIAWIVPALIVVVTWFFGPGSTGSVAAWAVLLHPIGSIVAGVVSAVVFSSGAVAFIGGLARPRT